MWLLKEGKISILTKKMKRIRTMRKKSLTKKIWSRRNLGSKRRLKKR
mgnify:CR=1 FL=1